MDQGSNGYDPLGNPNDADTVDRLFKENTELWQGATDAAAKAPPDSPRLPPSHPGTAYNRLPPLELEQSHMPLTPQFVAERRSQLAFLDTDASLAGFLPYGVSIVPTHKKIEEHRAWLHSHGAYIYDEPRPGPITHGSTTTEGVRAEILAKGLLVKYSRRNTTTKAPQSRTDRRDPPSITRRWVYESYKQQVTQHDVELANYRQANPEFPPHPERPPHTGSPPRQPVFAQRGAESRPPSRRNSGRYDQQSSRGGGSSQSTMVEGPPSVRSSRRGSMSSDVTRGGGKTGEREEFTEQELSYTSAGLPRTRWSFIDQGSAYGFAKHRKSWYDRVEGHSTNE
jgi:hypothetical protein